MKKIKDFIDKCWIKTTALYQELPRAAKIGISVVGMCAVFVCLIALVQYAG